MPSGLEVVSDRCSRPAITVSFPKAAECGIAFMKKTRRGRRSGSRWGGRMRLLNASVVARAPRWAGYLLIDLRRAHL